MMHIYWQKALACITRVCLLVVFAILLLCCHSIYIRATDDTATENLVSGMTLREKVGQMFIVSFYGYPMNDAARDLLVTYQPGGVVLLPSNLGTPQDIARLTNDIQQHVTIPALIAIDQEGGLIARLDDGFTEWPVPSLLTATRNTDLAQQFGAALAAELQAVGINMNLAPVADLYTNPANTVIGRRSFGSDPQQVAPIIAAVIQGMQSQGIVATAKHFPGHGDTKADSHLELPRLPYTTAELAPRELVPFQAAIDVDVAAIMMSHIYFPAIEPSPDVPASLSGAVTTGLLREQMRYEGLIVTDALDMDAIDTRYSPEDAAIQAILAGNDLILLGAHISPAQHAAALEAVIHAVEDGRIAESRIDVSVERILRTKAHFGVLDTMPVDVDAVDRAIPLDEHAQLVRRLFDAGITQVRGNQSQVASEQTLFIYPATRPPIQAACQKANWQSLGISEYPTESEIAAAAQAATNAAQVIIITQNAVTNRPLQNLVQQLPADKTTVVALWSPFDASVLPATEGYIVTYSPLRASYEPLCAILHGRQPARGRFSLSLALSLDGN